MIIFTPKEIIDLLSLRFEIPKIKGISKKTFKNVVNNKTTPREDTLGLITDGLEKMLLAAHVEDNMAAAGAEQMLHDLRQLDKNSPLGWDLLVGVFRRGMSNYEEHLPVTQTERLILVLEEISAQLRGLAKDNNIAECKELLVCKSDILAEWDICIDHKRLSQVEEKRDLIRFTTLIKVDTLLAIISTMEEEYLSTTEHEGGSRYIKLAPKLKIIDLPNKNEKGIVVTRPVLIWFERIKDHLGFSINKMATLVTGLGDKVPTLYSQKREIRRWKNGQYPSWPSIIGFIKNVVDEKHPDETDVNKFDIFIDGLMSFAVARLFEASFFAGILATQKVIPGVDVPVEGFDWDEKLVESYYKRFTKVLKGHMRW